MSSPTAETRLPLPAAPPPGLAEDDLQRRRALMAQWRRRSRLVMVIRQLLPVLCGLILVALIGWAAVNTLFWRLGGAHQDGGLTIRMLKPNFQGRDAAGKPFVLSADSAVRGDRDVARVSMDNPVFVQGSTALDKTTVRARHGIYREDTRMLDLSGNVQLDDGQGYHFVTEHAVIDTVKNNVDGEVHIDGNGPMGRIAASSYAVRNGGAYVYFKGQVKARIEQHGAQAALAGSAAPLPAAGVK